MLSFPLAKGNLVVGQQATLPVKAHDAAGNELITADATYKSSDVSIATVDAKGVVTAIKAGKVTITGTAGKDHATCELVIA